MLSKFLYMLKSTASICREFDVSTTNNKAIVDVSRHSRYDAARAELVSVYIAVSNPCYPLANHFELQPQLHCQCYWAHY